jgi:hypothetical protein
MEKNGYLIFHNPNQPTTDEVRKVRRDRVEGVNLADAVLASSSIPIIVPFEA